MVMLPCDIRFGVRIRPLLASLLMRYSYCEAKLNIFRVDGLIFFADLARGI